MKYIVDNVKNYSKTKDWICGHFFPEDSIQKTSELEIKYSVLQPGETSPPHYHPYGTEVSLIVKGKLKWRVDNEEFILGEGDFVFMGNNIVESVLEVYETAVIVSIRTPSVTNNKVNIEE